VLTIRREQKARLAEERFAERLVEKLGTEFAAYVAGVEAAELRRRVHEQIARGRSYGLTWESSIGAFTILGVVVGPGFERHPKIQHVLADESLSPDERGLLLIEQLTADEWEGVARHAP
jgi:hypothetical protein